MCLQFLCVAFYFLSQRSGHFRAVGGVFGLGLRFLLGASKIEKYFVSRWQIAVLERRFMLQESVHQNVRGHLVPLTL